MCVSRVSRGNTSESQLGLALIIHHVVFGSISGPVHKLAANKQSHK